jgi:Putative peptidoglycan binding domain
VSSAAGRAIRVVPRPRISRRAWTRIVVVLAVLVAAAAAIVVVVNPFGSPSGGAAAEFDNGAPTGTTRISRRDLSSQTLVSATLGYADAGTIVQPSGTSPSALQQAEQAVTAAASTLGGANATAAADAQTLARDRATLAADLQKRAADCGGDSAAQAASPGQSGTAGACASDVQAAASAQQAVTADGTKVAGDRRAADSAQGSLAAAQSSLATARTSASSYGQTSTYTQLPAVGDIVSRGEPLYGVDGAPVLLLYGSATAWRALGPGVAPGPDVAALNANLRALGYGAGLQGDAFGADTEAAVKALQAARGLAQTGSLPLGSIVFQPGAVRVTSVTPSRGATVQPGPVLGVTATTRQVTIALDAASQTHVKVGDPVEITLPDNSTTPGKVSYVGSVATVPSDNGNGGGGSPTIEVDVTPTDPAATGRLDQAPVNVAITVASVRNALTVPVNALLALANGGYALEEIAADGSHHLVAVDLGLFDDADGLVQVSGSGVAAGQTIVVPGE